MQLCVIAAVARNGAIGKDNQLLWRLPEDLKFFKRTTMGCPVLMGRKTFDSIGRPLPNRRNIVVTRNADGTLSSACVQGQGVEMRVVVARHEGALSDERRPLWAIFRLTPRRRTPMRVADMLRIKGVNVWVHELDAVILADLDGVIRVWNAGADLTADLHSTRVDTGVSTVAALPEIREWVDAQLRALPAARQVSDFQCVEGWGVPDVEWTGVRMQHLIDLVRPSKDAGYVTFHSLTGIYRDSLSMQQAGLPDVLLAYEMDGAPLSRAHGFPLRLVMPRMYGYKGVKWVTRLELGDRALPGYWEQHGYDSDAWVGRSNGISLTSTDGLRRRRWLSPR